MPKATSDILKVFIALFVTIAFFGCAQVGVPSGGPKDETPPKVIAINPGQGAIEYSGKSLVISFDEFVQLKDINSNLIISPVMEEAPNVKIKGKSVVVEFKEALKDSITYTFDFGKSIIDFNEGNIADSNVFVFSTGLFLDTLSISGTVKKSGDGSTEKDIFVFLYTNTEDSVPLKEKPFYLAKTAEDGTFKFRNIKSGVYKVFALKDLNTNFIFDQPTEYVGFLDTLLRVDSNLNLALEIFEEEQPKQYVKKTDASQYGKVNFIFNQPIDSFSLFPVNYIFPDPQWYVHELSPQKDTLTIWLTNIEDGLQSFDLQLSDNQNLNDTISIKIPKKESVAPGAKAGRSKVTPLVLNVQLNAGLSAPLKFGTNPEIILSHPAENVDFSKVILTQGNDTLPFEYKVRDQRVAKAYEIIHQWKEDSLYNIFIPPGAVTDIFKLTNDTVKTEFKIRKQSSYGDFALTLKVPQKDHQFILELMKDKTTPLNKVIVKNDEKVEFKLLEPGQYMLKITYDENNNGKWDTGNYLQKRQPEKVVFYTGNLTVKENWTLDVDWILEPAEMEKKTSLEDSEEEDD
jgi:uncharacterized protein (DUF2141 family)